MTQTPSIAAAGPQPSQTADEAKPKRYQPPAEHQKTFSAERPASFKRFGTKRVVSPSEGSQPAAKGLLISACLETETASASNSRTGGLSAFTYAVLRVLEQRREGATTRDVFDQTAAVLKDLGFRQTPQYLADSLEELANRTFITLEEPTMPATDTIQSSNGPIEISEQDVQEKLFTAFVSQLPAIIEASNGQQPVAEDDDEEEDVPAALMSTGATGSEAQDKAWQMLAVAVGERILKEVGSRASNYVEERLNGGKERDRGPRVVRRGPAHARQKAVNFGGLATAATRNLEAEVLPVLLNMAKRVTPAVMSLIQEQVERAKRR
jgi:hypothetical protein